LEKKKNANESATEDWRGRAALMSEGERGRRGSNIKGKKRADKKC